jgi:MFS family permease
MTIPKDLMYHKFRAYGFLKNLRFFDPFIILFFREMGLSFLEIGGLFSIREIATNLLEIPTGVIADAYGRRKAMIASFSFYLLSFVLFYLVPRFSIYVLAMILFAFGETFRSGTHKAMILEYLRIKGIEEQKVEYYGHTRAASQLGSALAALIAAGLVFHTGSYRIVFLASIIPYIIELFLMASYPEELDGALIPVEGGWRKKLAGRVGVTMRDFLTTLRRPRLLRGLSSSASFDAVFKASKDYLQPILQTQALALPMLLSVRADQRVAIVVGALYFIIYLGTSAASANAHWVKERARSLSHAVNLTYLLGVSLLIAAGIATWFRIYSLAIVAFLGFYLLQNVRRPIMVGYLTDLIPHRTMATGLSVESQLRTLITAVLAPLVGLLADRIGVGGALAILAVAAASLLPVLRVQSKEARISQHHQDKDE